jgi:hypothetical protein
MESMRSVGNEGRMHDQDCEGIMLGLPHSGKAMQDLTVVVS